jgi:hypothetical protein
VCLRFPEELNGPGCYGMHALRVLAGSGYSLQWSTSLADAAATAAATAAAAAAGAAAVHTGASSATGMQTAEAAVTAFKWMESSRFYAHAASTPTTSVFRSVSVAPATGDTHDSKSNLRSKSLGKQTKPIILKTHATECRCEISSVPKHRQEMVYRTNRYTQYCIELCFLELWVVGCLMARA